VLKSYGKTASTFRLEMSL